MRIFRPRPSPYQTALAMVGAKPANRVLVIGASAPQLAAQIALVTGLNGQTVVAAGDQDREALEKAAADAGSLVEITPPEVVLTSRAAEPFDVVCLPVDLSALGPGLRRERFRAAFQPLRSGGRIVVIDEPPKRRFGFGSAGAIDPAPVVADLVAAGALAARHLATSEGIGYYEGRKA